MDFLYISFFDWLISIYVNQLLDARKFCDFLMSTCGDCIKDVEFVEVLRPVKKSWIINPHAKDIKNYL